ncbi:hypothetical protein PMIN05_004687 [Paraphaeosphaeria minitans]
MNTILPEESPLHVADATKNRYIGITLAGKGSTAEVWYAIPCDVVSLRSRVCAVKLYRLYASRIYIKNELPAIKRLQTLSGHLRARFTEPLDFSDEAEKDDPCWFAMKVVQGFTLTQLRKAIFLSKRTVPEEFVFHMYIQLHEALKFLHTSDPPMTKGDLVAVNIMIDPTTEDVPGFPNIKLIDFGGAQVGEYTNDSVFAAGGGNGRNCFHGIEFTDLVDSLGYVLAARRCLDGSNLEQVMNLQERLPRVLKITRHYASPEALQAIERLLEETRKSIEISFPTDQQILDALNGSVSTTSSRL